MYKKLFIPGPTHVRDEVLEAMATRMIGHRSKDYVALQAEVIAKVQKLLYTEKRIFLSTSSSTGLMEGAVRNCVGKKCLNTVCGRHNREGERLANPGVLSGPFPRPAQAIPTELLPPLLSWGEGPESRFRGLRQLFGEMPTTTLAEEILQPGEGRIRALIVNGGNPALVLAEAESALAALEDLELLVVLDLFPSATAAYADYVFGVRHPFERVDVSKLMDATYPFPFAHYTEALVDGPEETIEEWQLFWELAMRLGLPLRVGPLHATERPSSDELLDAMYQHARLPLSEMRAFAIQLRPPGVEPERQRDVEDYLRRYAQRLLGVPIDIFFGTADEFSTVVEQRR